MFYPSVRFRTALFAGACFRALGFQANQQVLLALSSEANVAQPEPSNVTYPEDVSKLENPVWDSEGQHLHAAEVLLDQSHEKQRGTLNSTVHTAATSAQKVDPKDRNQFEKKYNYVFFFYHPTPKYPSIYKEVAVVMLCIGYTLCAIVYSHKQRATGTCTGTGTGQKKERVLMFDVGRFFLEYVVVGFHSIGMFFPGLTWWHILTVPYRMFGFFLLSGIFGSGMTYESVARISCVCFVTAIFAIGIEIGAACVMTGDISYAVNSTQMGLWFLFALALMRWFITPFFHLMNALGSDARWSLKSLSWIIVFIASYVLSHTIPWMQLNKQLSQRLFFFTFYVPYFATGLLGTPGQWSKFYALRWVRVACYIYWIVFYSFIGGPNDQWDSVYCYKEQCHNYHMPDISFLAPLSWSGFALEIEMCILRTGLMISYFGIIGTVTEFFQTFMPYLAECLAEWGTRTLFSYVLHLTLFGRMFYESGLAQTVRRLPLNVPTKYCILAVFVMWYNVILCSQLTERLFRWLCIPFWVKNLAEQAAGKLAGEMLMDVKPNTAAQKISI